MTEKVSSADFRHGRDELVEHAALTEQQVGAGFGSICFEMPVHAECLAGSAEERQEDDGEGIDEQQPVAALRIFDANLRDPLIFSFAIWFIRGVILAIFFRLWQS